jgi:hypothetical protein
VALIVCPLCVREDDIQLIRTLPDGRKEVRCDDCDFVFAYGVPTPEPKAAAPRRTATRTRAPARPAAIPLEVARRQFQAIAEVPDDVRARVDALKAEFLQALYEPDPVVVSHWRKFGWAFSAEGIDRVAEFDLKQFVHDRTGLDQGSTVELDKAWTLMGELDGARRVRGTVQHLLRGHGPVEDRLTDLVDNGYSLAMPGFGEALLTKTLAISDADRFLPIGTYTEKREIVASLTGLELPESGTAAWTIGRLAVWSNDLLVDLAGNGFDDLHHAAEFLRWTKER